MIFEIKSYESKMVPTHTSANRLYPITEWNLEQKPSEYFINNELVSKELFDEVVAMVKQLMVKKVAA